MSKQLPTLISELRQGLHQQTRSIQAVLPKGMDIAKFQSTAMNAIQTSDRAEDLLRADRQSLFNACQKAAGDGLLLDGHEAALTVFKNKVAYMPMVQGMVKLARQHPDVLDIYANVVYENDKFRYVPGKDEEPVFEPDWKIAPSKRGDPVLVYAVVILRDAKPKVTIQHKERVMTIAAGGKNAYQYDPKKAAHWEEWWKKTAIKNVLKYAPKTTELDRAMASDNEGYQFDAGASAKSESNYADANDLNAALGGEAEEKEVAKPEPSKPKPKPSKPKPEPEAKTQPAEEEPPLADEHGNTIDGEATQVDDGDDDDIF